MVFDAATPACVSRCWPSRIVGAWFVLGSPHAQAHQAAIHGTDFTDGLMQFLTSVEFPLGTIALGLFAAQHGRDAVAWSVIALPIGLIAGAIAAPFAAMGPGVVIANLAAIAILGLAVALAVPVPAFVLPIAAFLLGIGQGFPNTGTMPSGALPELFLLGVVVAALLSLVGATALAWKAQTPWQRVAVRALGSWISAIGLMVLGLQLAA